MQSPAFYNFHSGKHHNRRIKNTAVLQSTWEKNEKRLIDEFLHDLQLMKLGKAVLGKTLFAYIMKQTFYGQFVAGEDRQSIKPAIHRMHSFGVKSILDYSVEEDLSEEQAKQIEMDACVADEEKDNYNPDTVPHKGDYSGEWSGMGNFVKFLLIF